MTQDDDSPRPSRLTRLYPALESRDFRHLWMGVVPSTVGWQMTVVTTGYAALVLSGSPAVLGIVSSLLGLPLLLFALPSGVVADRLPRRAILMATQTMLCLGAATLTVLAATGLLQVWQLAVLGFVQGTAMTFNMPARQALVAELAGGRRLRSAVAITSAGMNAARVVGPALAGALLAIPSIGIPGVFGLNVALFALVVLLVSRLPSKEKPLGEAPRRTGGWDELLEGLRYIRGSPVLLAILGLALVPLTLGMPIQQLMPIFSEQVFHVGAAGLGLLMAVFGIGALGGSLAAAQLASVSHPGRVQLLMGVVFGLGLVAFALAPVFAAAVALLLVVGFASATYIALNNTLVMSNTEPRLHGRVMSVYLLTFATMPLGTLPLSWIAEQVGGRATVAGAGIVLALVVAGVALLYPPFRRIH